MAYENRNNPRAPLDIYVNKYINGVPFMARAKDISIEGIYLDQLIEPAGDSKIGIQFQLPGTDDVIYAEGIVIRSGKDGNGTEGNGILFTMMTDHDRKLVKDYIDSWLKMSGSGNV